MKRFFRKNALLIATVTSVVLGVLIGVLCRPLNPSSDTILLVGFPGEIFLRMLKLLMLPLIFASIVTGVLVYCLVFGVILSRLGRKGEVVSRFFAGINYIILQMIQLVMWISPVGIMFLIASQVMSSKDLSTMGRILVLYVATEFSSQVIHTLVALPIFYFILTRGNAFKVYVGTLQALLTALATSSSAATLPVTMRCMEKRLKIDSRITEFVLPIGTTVNMDGGAIFAVLGPVFIAQFNRVHLSFPEILLISLTALLSSVSSAGVPGSGFAVLLLVLQAIGLPDRGIPLLLTVNWLMDRSGTVVNVASDCLAVGVTSHHTELAAQEKEESTVMTADSTIKYEDDVYDIRDRSINE